MTGFRLGYACGPAELIEAMMKIHQYTMLCASSLSQKAALEALARPETDIAEMVDEYRRRRNFIAAAFAEMGLECHRPLGAFYAFPSVAKFGLPAKEFSLAVAARGEGGGGARHGFRGLRRGLRPLRLRHQPGEHQGGARPPATFRRAARILTETPERGACRSRLPPAWLPPGRPHPRVHWWHCRPHRHPISAPPVAADPNIRGSTFRHRGLPAQTISLPPPLHLL